MTQISPLSSAQLFLHRLRSAVRRRDLAAGRRLHGLYIKSLVPSSPYLSNHLITLYCKCNQFPIARKVFDEIPHPNVFSHNALLAGISSPNEASDFFHRIPGPDLVSYNTLLSIFAAAGLTADALRLLSRMRRSSSKVDGFTLSSVVSALGCGVNQLHSLAVSAGLDSYVSVCNALISSYSRTGFVDSAEKVFGTMPDEFRDGVSWNCMIVAYGQNKRGQEALNLFGSMVRKAFEVDMYTLASVLTAFTSVKDLLGGLQFHANLIKSSFERNPHVGSGLIDLYSKCGGILDAMKVFEEIDEPDLVLWNTMISGYSLNDEFSEEGVDCFRGMLRAGFCPDDCSFVCVITSCSNLSSPSMGQQMHALALKSDFPSNGISVNNALIAMYSKCANLKDARRLFERMLERNTVSFNSMISGYAHHGLGNEALVLFRDMLDSKNVPTSITFISVLSACSHTGRVDDGWLHFNSMENKYGIERGEEHYSCMIDLLARAGKLEEAEGLIETMPFDPSSFAWAALLGACRTHGNLELGAKAAEKLLVIEPWNASAYVMLSNMYASKGRWDEFAKVRTLMRDRGVKKKPGCSWIELEKRIHVFVADEVSHPRIQEVHKFLEEITGRMKGAGYVPDVRWALAGGNAEEGEMRLRHHSEKLAVAFGLMSTRDGVPILVVKNLRICGDCHNAIKLISSIARREITVRDAHRFHCFREGRCSCGDYW